MIDDISLKIKHHTFLKYSFQWACYINYPFKRLIAYKVKKSIIKLEKWMDKKGLRLIISLLVSMPNSSLARYLAVCLKQLMRRSSVIVSYYLNIVRGIFYYVTNSLGRT